jgi:hypothetical protein
MKTSRRKFSKIIGASIVAPAVVPVAGLSLWERAETKFQQTGEISAEVVRMLLDLQGPHGIYDDPKHFEDLRAALARTMPDHRVIQSLDFPPDIEPILSLKR